MERQPRSATDAQLSHRFRAGVVHYGKLCRVPHFGVSFARQPTVSVALLCVKVGFTKATVLHLHSFLHHLAQAVLASTILPTSTVYKWVHSVGVQLSGVWAAMHVKLTMCWCGRRAQLGFVHRIYSLDTNKSAQKSEDINQRTFGVFLPACSNSGWRTSWGMDARFAHKIVFARTGSQRVRRAAKLLAGAWVLLAS